MRDPCGMGECVNTYGGYTCTCKKGFAVQNGDRMCTGYFDFKYFSKLYEILFDFRKLIIVLGHMVSVCKSLIYA